MGTNAAKGNKPRAVEAAPGNGQDPARLIHELSEKGLSLDEIHAETGIPRSTVHVMLQRRRAQVAEEQEVEASVFKPDRSANTFLQMLASMPGIAESRLNLARNMLKVNPAIVTVPMETLNFLTRGLGMGDYVADQVTRGWHSEALAREPNLVPRLAPTAGAYWAPQSPPVAPPAPESTFVNMLTLVDKLGLLNKPDTATSEERIARAVAAAVGPRPQGLDPQIQAMLTQLQVQNATVAAQMDSMRQQGERDQQWMAKLMTHQQTEAQMKQELVLAKSQMTAADQVSLEVVRSATAAFTKATDKSDQRMDRLERTVGPFIRSLANQGQGLGVPVPTSQAELSAIAGAGQPFEPTLEPGVTEPVEEIFPGPSRSREGGTPQ